MTIDIKRAIDIASAAAGSNLRLRNKKSAEADSN
jgi:hypothetical protein